MGDRPDAVARIGAYHFRVYANAALPKSKVIPLDMFGKPLADETKVSQVAAVAMHPDTLEALRRATLNEDGEGKREG